MTYCTKCGKPTNNGIMCEDCLILGSPWLSAMKRKENDLEEELAELKFENAALRARIDKFDDLHIHMGEAIYIITDNNEIIERFICGIHILSTEIIFVTAITANYKPCDKKGVAAQGWHCIKNNLGLIPLRYFGERAFTDRAAAEARLNEMKGEKE